MVRVHFGYIAQKIRSGIFSSGNLLPGALRAAMTAPLMVAGGDVILCVDRLDFVII